MRRPKRLCRDHEFAPRQRQRCRPRHPHEGGNAEHAENEGQVEDRLPEKGGHGQRQDQGRKRQQHIHAADHHRFEPAAEIAGEHAERAADGKPDHRRTQADDQRYPRAIDQARELVAAKPVGAEPVLPPKTAHAAPACPCRLGSAAAARSAKIATRKHEEHPADRRPEQHAKPAALARRAGLQPPRQCSSSSVAMADPGVEYGVEHIDDEVHR